MEEIDQGSRSESPLVSLLTANAREYGIAAILGIVLLLNVTGVWKTAFGLDTAIFVTAVAGYKTFYNSITALLEKQISADVALCVAVIAALAIGEYVAAAEAMFIVMVGETLESFAAGRTEAAIERFVARLPRVARRLVSGREEEVEAASLMPGDRVIVRAGERVSADGIVEQGTSFVDESSINGEPLAKEKQPGDEVFSGTLNGNALLKIRVTRAGPETTLARVVKLVEEAKQKRAPVERLADHYAKFFLPALLLAGALTFYLTGNWMRTVAVLIVACPCALILATPTAMVAAIGGLARRGILVRGASVLQNAAMVNTVVFDKTGTITEGRFTISRIIAIDRPEDDIVALVAAAERGSTHALARVIMEESQRRRLHVPEAESAEVIPGRGVQSVIAGRTVRAGNATFLTEHGVARAELLREEADRAGATAVLVAEDDRLAGAILFCDRAREGARSALKELDRIGITEQWILTGDRRPVAEAVARDIGIANVASDLMPAQKQDRIRELTANGRVVAMVGDGINDAPALAASSVGIAVAGASDITAEAADVVYMPHSLDGLPHLFETARRAMFTARLNIFLFAGALNLIAVLACATGRLGPIGAAFTHQISSFCVMMNSLRLLRLQNSSRASWRHQLQSSELWFRIRSFQAATLLLWAQERRRELFRITLIAAASLFVLSGFYAVKSDEIGVIERFGRKVTPLSAPGLHYKLPWPIDRLTRIQARRVRVVEIGFRSNPRGASGAAMEPAAYEWNVQHRGGRIESRPEESLTLTGDQNLIELNATVHYEVTQPDAFLFGQTDGDATMRAAAESVIRGRALAAPMDDVLTIRRREIERESTAELQRRMDCYETGLHVIRVKLEIVHPSREVVDDFRDVSAAFEEKNRMVNEAEGYRNEQIALARGNARALIENARAYTLGRTNRAQGDAGRFSQQEIAFHGSPGPTQARLYFETMEQVLAGKKKLIVDSGSGRRHLLLLEEGAEIAPLAVPQR